MKKQLFRLATAGFLAGAILFSVSGSPQGHVSLVNKTYGEEQPPNYRPYYLNCSDDYQIVVCGAGNSTCTPDGECE